MSSFCKRGVYSSEKNVLSKLGFEYVTSWLNVICLVSHGGSSTVISGFTGLFYNLYFLIKLNSWTNTVTQWHIFVTRIGNWKYLYSNGKQFGMLNWDESWLFGRAWEKFGKYFLVSISSEWVIILLVFIAFFAWISP